MMDGDMYSTKPEPAATLPPSPPKNAKVESIMDGSLYSESDAQIRELLKIGRVRAALKILESSTEPVGEALAELVRSSVERAEAIVRQYRDHDGWSKCYDKDGLSLYYRRESGIHSIKCTASYDGITPGEVISMAREFDLVKEWNKFTNESSVLKVEHMLKIYCHADLQLPWPITNRDIVVCADAFDLLAEEGLIVARIDSVDSTPYESQLPDSAKSNVRALLSASGFVIRPLQPGPEGESRCEACLVANIDPQMAAPPAPLIRFLLKVGCPYIYKTMSELLSKISSPDSKHQQQMRENPALYGLIRSNVAKYLESGASVPPGGTAEANPVTDAVAADADLQMPIDGK